MDSRHYKSHWFEIWFQKYISICQIKKKIISATLDIFLFSINNKKVVKTTKWLHISLVIFFILSRPKAGLDLRLSMGVDGYIFQWILTQLHWKVLQTRAQYFQWILTQICTKKCCAIIYGGRWIYVPVNFDSTALKSVANKSTILPVNFDSNLHWKVLRHNLWG